MLGCAVSKWKTPSGVLGKSARPARDRRWISSVQFSHARKAKEINGGSLSWPLQDTCATSCPSLEALSCRTPFARTLHNLSGPSPRDQESTATRPGLEAQWCHDSGYLERQHVECGTSCLRTGANKQTNIHTYTPEWPVCGCCCSQRGYTFWSDSTTLSSSVTE